MLPDAEPVQAAEDDAPLRLVWIWPELAAYGEERLNSKVVVCVFQEVDGGAPGAGYGVVC